MGFEQHRDCFWLQISCKVAYTLDNCDSCDKLRETFGKVKTRKEAIYMKKSLLILSVLVIALAVGTAYAGSNDMIAGDYNAITVFDRAPLPSHDLGAGLILGNGVTAFDIRAVKYNESEGVAAGGLRSTEPSMEWQNGITVF
jgi:hypothetical protein